VPQEAAVKRLSIIGLTLLVAQVSTLRGQGDAGAGIRTSMIETYVEPHQLLIYPFYAHTWDHNFEYQPFMFGGTAIDDFRGQYRSNEVAVFLAYGVTDWLALEIEGSQIAATFDKSPADTTGTPAHVAQSGTSDFGGQLRFRFGHNREHRPEFFGSIEAVPPSHGNQVLIGETQWNVKGEVGAMRAYHWGTVSFRTTIEYNQGDSHWDLGETSLEYLRQMAPSWRLLLGIEGGEGGAPDDYVFVAAGHWRIARALDLKVANGLGLFSKSTDWEAQIGLMASLR